MPARAGIVQAAKMKLDTPLIYGLLACVLLISAPHADHLPLWVSSLSALLLGWRAYLAYGDRLTAANGVI